MLIGVADTHPADVPLAAADAVAGGSLGQEVAARPHLGDHLLQPAVGAGIDAGRQPPAAPEDLDVDQQLLQAEDGGSAEQAGADQEIGPGEGRQGPVERPLVAGLDAGE